MTALAEATPLQLQFRQAHLERRARWASRAVEDHGIDLKRKLKPAARIMSIIPEPAPIPQQEDLLREISGAMRIPEKSILEDLSDPRCKDARSIYAALLVRYAGWASAEVERATGFVPATIAEALGINDPIWHAHVIGRQAPLASVVAIMVQSWAAMQEEARYGVTDIMKAVARAWDMDWRELKSSRRTKAIVVPRHVAMVLAKILTLKSLPEIGRQFGKRDHTTILHALRKYSALTAELREKVPAGSPLDLYAVTAKAIVAP